MVDVVPAGGERGLRGERRIVTVLFCDVVGSTAMAEQLDAEDWAEVMNEAFEFMTGPISRYEGTVARLMGDAVMALFGAPLAHEEDPQRAVLAGLEIVDGIQPFKARMQRELGLDFNVRVGINTGPVVMGDVGTGAATEYTAMGDAVNVAARMEQSAQPGTVQVAEATHKLVAPLFDFESLGGIEVKGKTAPIPAYRVLGRKATPGRVRGIEGLDAPLIGREAELEVLRRAVAEVRQGRGSIVSLIGEAGLGKSRLVDEARADWPSEHARNWIEARGIAYDMTHPYGLLHQQSRRLLGVEDGDSPEMVREKVAEVLEDFPPDQRANCARALEILLSLRAAPDGRELKGEALKRELFTATLTFWRYVASRSPLVMVFDDLHWADPASVELLQHLFHLTDEVPLLFLCAFRPERRSPAWQVKQYAETELPHRYTEVMLRALSAGDTDNLVDSLLAIADLPPDLRRLILEKTEGNPFFVEEVVRTLTESGAVVRENGSAHWRVTGKVEDIAIPDNLQALLVSRIDRLEEDERRTLQLAAVIGKTFHYQVLKEVSESNGDLDRQLSTLQRVELVRETARVPEVEYAFRHELTRQAAYDSILRRRRPDIHRRVGQAIETLFPDRLDEEVHRLAYHFFEAREDERALRYSTMAGDAAAHVYANAEAIRHYAHAVDVAKRSSAPNDQLIHLYTKRGRAMELSARHDEALHSYEELQALGHERGEPALELAGLIPQATLFSTLTVKFDPARGEDLSNQTLAMAQELGDARAEAKALWNLTLVRYFGHGDAAGAVAYGERSLAIAREHGLKEELAYALNDLVRPYLETGQLEEANSARDEATELWRSLDNIPMLADSLNSAASGRLFAGDLDGAMSLGQECLRVCRSSNNTWAEGVTQLVISLVLAERGDMGEALGAVAEATRLGKESAFAPASVGGPVMAAWLYATLGDLERAAESARLAVANVSEASGQRMFVDTAHLQVHYYGGDAAGVEAALTDAYEDLSRIESSPYLRYLHVIGADAALAQGRGELAQRIAEHVLGKMESSRMRVWRSDMLRVKAQALLADGRVDDARAVLTEAAAQAQAIGSRRALWEIAAALGQLEQVAGNADAARAARARARDAIAYIAEHTGSAELRESFLRRSEVQAAMDGQLGALASGRPCGSGLRRTRRAGR